MKYLLYILATIGILAVMFALRIAVRSYLGERADFVRTPRSELSRHPEQAGIAGLQEITFGDSAGSTQLAGWYAPSANLAAIVLIHGTQADRSATLNEAAILSQAGFGILAIDLPGHGASEGRSYWSSPERQAVSAAIDWLSARPEVDAHRIGGLGQSRGGYILTQAAVGEPRLRSIVLEGCPSDIPLQYKTVTVRWGPLSYLPTMYGLHAFGMTFDMQPVDVINRLAPRPVLIIHGDRDDVVPPFMAWDLYYAAQEPKELWLVHGAHHLDFLQVAPTAYRAHLTDFFRRTLLN